MNSLCYKTRTNYTFSSIQDESWQPFWRLNGCYRERSKRQNPELICYEIRTKSEACVARGWHPFSGRSDGQPNAQGIGSFASGVLRLNGRELMVGETSAFH